MSFLVRKKPGTETVDSEEQDPETRGPVTSCLYIKPHPASDPEQEQQRVSLDKDVVLRRIRHRKRVNKVQNVLQALLTASVSGVSADERLWLDDAFSAP
ncbi:hypothetical protein CKAN_00253400 [Cinnamomum micranthum f. kanehirae]|uniref:Uncharacterized protein n=1 Tax=Cinnamomum micranthum f. kanehirae TaxID=337451 RepID=A0A3S3M6P8_9MAGN|nr:hypothetical protein CKAN_00253300 [Cinnamomum micranthum f. kanehirae]RWR74215.1 hypothetical protein CKAN_00253400 [Cinnamomum micranthum f. kanehirae]